MKRNLCKKNLFLALILLIFLAFPLCGKESEIPEKIRYSVGKYPELSVIKPDLRYPVGSSFGVDQYGNFVVGGKIRWLLGTQPSKDYCFRDVLPTTGYPDKLKWIYETVLNYNTAQRLGFDTIAPFTSSNFLNKIKPEYKVPGFHGVEPVIATNHMLGDSGLPLLVDFTATPDKKGILNSNHKKWGDVLPEEALNKFQKSGVNHWVPYNVLHPAARKVYRTYLKEGALELTRKSPVVCYELFNEPGYDDPGSYNRTFFADFLQRKYGTVKKMNKVYGSKYASFKSASDFKYKNENPGLAVDWSKFMEDSFTSLCEFGRNAIWELYPKARVSVQPCGNRHYRQITKNHVNILQINNLMNVISLPTGGGIVLSEMEVPSSKVLDTPANSPNVGEGFLQRQAFLALADGKPIVNGELYVGTSEDEICLRVWLDMLRGSNATYAFSWVKYAWAWKPKNRQGGMKYHKSYLMVNPYNEVELWGFMRAKREIFRFAPWFVPRQNRPKSELAIILSYPTERRAEAVGNHIRNEVASYASALAFSHINADALFEEQLAAGREKRYKVILAAGISNVYKDTPQRLLKFVEAGGILIIARSFMHKDEYGHPLTWGNNALNFKIRENKNAATRKINFKFPTSDIFTGIPKGRNTVDITAGADWQILASCGGTPALLKKKAGKGIIYVITPEMRDYSIASLLIPILKRHGISPKIQVLRAKEKDLAVNVELHYAEHNGVTLCFLANHDLYPKLIFLRSPLLSAGQEVANLSNMQKLRHQNGTSAPICLSGGGYAVIGFGKDGSLTPLFGKLKEQSVAAEQKQYKAAMTNYQKMLRQRHANKFHYSPNLSRTRTIDLRSFCNRGFGDARAGDGKGGWTDQGPDNSLHRVPWGVHNLIGVPCDLIRFDENNNKTCIVLNSKSQKGKLPTEVQDIPVGGKVRALYFFHTTAWSKEKLGMTYRIHYASGKTVDVPVMIGKDVDDWWISHHKKVAEKVAWKNNLKRGFYCMEWLNPTPDDDVVSLDIVSPNSKVVPIVIGITAEEYVPEKSVKWSSLRGRPFNNAGVRFDKNLCESSVSAATGAWAGFECRGKTSLPFDKDGVIRFKINGGKDRFGTHKGNQRIFLRLVAGKYKKRTVSGKIRIEAFIPEGKVDSLPDTWQEVTIPLNRFKKTEKLKGKIDALSFQFNNCGHIAGIAIKDISVSIPSK